MCVKYRNEYFKVDPLNRNQNKRESYNSNTLHNNHYDNGYNIKPSRTKLNQIAHK